MSILVTEPYMTFFGTDGLPIDSGKVYIGQPNQNPVVYPKTAYWDSSFTSAAVQPIGTIAGHPSRNGSIANIYVDGDYSIAIYDKNNILIYSELVQASASTLVSFALVSDLIGYTPALNLTPAEVSGYNTENDGGGGQFIWSSSTNKNTANGGTIIDPSVSLALQGTGVGLGCWVRQYSGAVNVKWFGAKGDGSTDDTASLQNAYDSTVLPLYIPTGIYRGWLYVRRDNSFIFGDGSSLSKIKLPDSASHTQPDEPGTGTVTGVPCVIDLGEITRGNNATAYTGCTIRGLTLDGNKANTTAPTLDVFGWGVSLTKFSKVYMDDVVTIDTHCGGVGQFINSNECAINATIYNAGFALGHPGYDMNSSKNSQVNVTAIDCNYGSRILDNCTNNTVSSIIKNATIIGFVYNNQAVNFSSNNIINVVIDGGCSASGLSIGDNCSNSNIIAAISNVTGFGVQQPDTSTSTGLNIRVSTYNGQSTGCYIGGDLSKWDIVTDKDGRQGAQGSHYAITVDGDNNTVSAKLLDTATWQVRGINLTSNSNNNNIVAYDYIYTADPFTDSGTGNIWWSNTAVAWQDATLINSWTNAFGAPYPVAGYLKSGNRSVRLRGVIQSGTLGTAAFNLPAGYRPAANVVYSTDTGRIVIDTNGDVTPTVGSDPFTLSVEFSII